MDSDLECKKQSHMQDRNFQDMVEEMNNHIRKWRAEFSRTAVCSMRAHASVLCDAYATT